MYAVDFLFKGQNLSFSHEFLIKFCIKKLKLVKPGFTYYVLYQSRVVGKKYCNKFSKKINEKLKKKIVTMIRIENKFALWRNIVLLEVFQPVWVMRLTSASVSPWPRFSPKVSFLNSHWWGCIAEELRDVTPCRSIAGAVSSHTCPQLAPDHQRHLFE